MPIDTAFVQNTLQPYFEKKLLPTLTKNLRLSQFAQKGTLGLNHGDTVRYFRPKWIPFETGVGKVSELNGSDPTDEAKVEFETIDLKFKEYGQWSGIRNVTSNTSLLNILNAIEKFMGEEFALKLDTVIRDAICAGPAPTLGNPGFGAKYAQGKASFAALVAEADLKKAIITPSDLTQAAQILKNNNVPQIGGYYIAVINPAVEYDILNNDVWQGIVKQNDAKKIYEGEIGEWSGIKLISANNPFVEKDVEWTYNFSSVPSERVYSTPVFGQNAFGDISIGIKDSSKPGNADANGSVRPKLLVISQPDRTDKLNQNQYVGWKTAYNATVLNPKFGYVIKSKSTLETAQAAQQTREEALASALATAFAAAGIGTTP